VDVDEVEEKSRGERRATHISSKWIMLLGGFRCESGGKPPQSKEMRVGGVGRLRPRRM